MTIDFDVSQAEWSRTMPEWHQYMTALFHDLIWWRGRQLTTGHDATCPARYSDESECAGAGDGFCVDVIDCTCKLIDSGTAACDGKSDDTRHELGAPLTTPGGVVGSAVTGSVRMTGLIPPGRPLFSPCPG